MSARCDTVADTFCDASTPEMEALTRESIRIMRAAAAVDPAPHAPPMFGYGVRVVVLTASPDGAPRVVRSASAPAWGLVRPCGAVLLVPHGGRS